MGKSPRRSLLMQYGYKGSQLAPNVRTSTSAGRSGGALALRDQVDNGFNAAAFLDQLRKGGSQQLLGADGYSRAGMDQAFKTGRAAGSPGLLQKSAALAGRSKLPLAGLALLGAGLGAAGEFADDDGIGINTSQATGNFLAQLAATGGLAALGTAIMPGVGTVALPALASMIGVQDRLGAGGAGLGEALYSGITGIVKKSPEEQKRENDLLNQRQNIALQAESAQTMGPILAQLAEMQDARNLRAFEKQAAIQANYNYQNSLNDGALSAQNQLANLNNIIAATAY